MSIGGTTIDDINLVAHASGTGWDEVVLALVPLLLSGVLFMWARNRIGQRVDT